MGNIERFQRGRYYSCRSNVDFDTVFRFFIRDRIDKSVIIQEEGASRIYRRYIKIIDGEETILPYGSYSLAPSLQAGKGRKND